MQGADSSTDGRDTEQAGFFQFTDPVGGGQHRQHQGHQDQDQGKDAGVNGGIQKGDEGGDIRMACNVFTLQSKALVAWIDSDTVSKVHRVYFVIVCHGLQIPTTSSETAQQRVKPDWAIVLAYEHKLRKEAMKKVLSGHTLSDALEAVIKDPDLKEAYFTTPMALRASMPEAQPNKFLRYNNKGGSGSFSGKQFAPFTKGKGKGSKGKSKGKPADPRLKGLSLAWRTPDQRELCFAWNAGDCDGSCGRVHQCRVKGCYASHKAVDHAKAAA